MELSEKAKQLLESGDVKVVLGFEPGTRGAAPSGLRPHRRRGRAPGRSTTPAPRTWPPTSPARKSSAWAGWRWRPGRRRCAPCCSSWPSARSRRRTSWPWWPTARGQVHELATAQAIEEHLALQPQQIPAEGPGADGPAAADDPAASAGPSGRRAVPLRQVLRLPQSAAPCATASTAPWTATGPSGCRCPATPWATWSTTWCAPCTWPAAAWSAATAARACPVGIPIHLLTFNAEESVHAAVRPEGPALQREAGLRHVDLPSRRQRDLHPVGALMAEIHQLSQHPWTP